MKINPRQLQQAMKKFGVKQEEIDATEVIIKTKTSELRVLHPSVARVNMMGEESLQISGEIVERPLEVEVREEDLSTVMEHAKVSRDEALAVVKKHNGDLAAAIMELSE